MPQDTRGYLGVETSINHMIKDLQAGTIDGIYLPNTRWFFGEEAGEMQPIALPINWPGWQTSL